MIMMLIILSMKTEVPCSQVFDCFLLAVVVASVFAAVVLVLVVVVLSAESCWLCTQQLYHFEDQIAPCHWSKKYKTNILEYNNLISLPPFHTYRNTDVQKSQSVVHFNRDR